jgi:predicted metalloprotease with PDZ domain
VKRFVILFFLFEVIALSQTHDPIRYTLRFPAPQSHYVEVEAEVPTAGEASVDLMMAVWTPGSYLVRDYAGQVEDVHATTADGESLGIAKTHKNRWRVDASGQSTFRLTYRVYCRQMTVRTNWVDSEFALLNGAPTFITRVDSGTGDAVREHFVKLELPAQWRESRSGLTSGTAAHEYVAADFETLVDSPIIAGNPQTQEFNVADKPHYLVNLGSLGPWDLDRTAKDAHTIVEYFYRMWGTLPYEQYSFFNMVTESRGGLEHKNSSVLMTSRWATSTREAYLKWLSLVSHEYFHVWNVKRLRPRALGPFDYEREVYTRDLWVAEGITGYYDDLTVRRAGLSTQKEYLEQLSNQIGILQTTPGRLTQTLSESSFDAWVKLYRRDENSKNSSISYYNKGALVAFLLDVHIREATAGTKSLDDVMKMAYQRFSGEAGFSTEDFQNVASEIAGLDLTDWFRNAIDSTDELDYQPALRYLGLRFKSVEPKDGEPEAWLGATTELRGGMLVVTEVPRGTPAFEAGLNAEDEIIATDEYRVDPGKFAERLGNYRPGDTLKLLVARREKMMALSVVLGHEPAKVWELEPGPDADGDTVARRIAWFGAE